MNLKGCRAGGTYSPQACRGAQPLARSWQERYRACLSLMSALDQSRQIVGVRAMSACIPLTTELLPYGNDSDKQRRFAKLRSNIIFVLC
jgi:hypothetical protein